MQTANFAPLTPLSFLERTADTYPDQTAFVYESHREDYSRFRRRVYRLASALRAAGMVTGDRVAVLAPNTPPILEAHFGVPLAGAQLVAINTRLSPGEVRTILRHSGARLLMVDEELWPTIAAIRDDLEDLERIIVDPLPGTPGSSANAPESPAAATKSLQSSRGEAEELATYEAVLAAASEDVQAPDVDERGVISINYTSGTTGEPKGVMYHHRGAFLNALGEVIEAQLQPQSVYLWTLPMFHCNGWCYPWAVTAIGATHVLLRRVAPPEILRLVAAEGVTHLSGAPTVLTSIAQEMERTGSAFPRRIKAVTAGAPPSPRVLRTMEELGADVLHVYGLTEVYGPFTVCAWHPEWDELEQGERASLKSRQGVPYIGLGEARVADSHGDDVPRDGETLGEVLLRGNGVMLGYYRNPGATEKAFEGGWFHTGDIGVWHPDGYIELKDRAKDIIISGGENISTQEVEKVIVEHPAVLEAAVIGIPDEKWGEVPKAFVTLRPGMDVAAEELIDFCRARLAHFKCPKGIAFTDLPKTSTGKIQKHVLRESEWQGREKRIN